MAGTFVPHWTDAVTSSTPQLRRLASESDHSNARRLPAEPSATTLMMLLPVMFTPRTSADVHRLEHIDYSTSSSILDGGPVLHEDRPAGRLGTLVTAQTVQGSPAMEW